MPHVSADQDRDLNIPSIEIRLVSDLQAKQVVAQYPLPVLCNLEAKVTGIIERHAEIPLHGQQCRDVAEQVQDLRRVQQRRGLRLRRDTRKLRWVRKQGRGSCAPGCSCRPSASRSPSRPRGYPPSAPLPASYRQHVYVRCRLATRRETSS